MHILIFGSNEQGFHGAGTAGFAMRGDFRNNWRNDATFLAAIKQGSGTRGLYAQYGIGRGFQMGHKGYSYAIATVTRPGQRRSVPFMDMQLQVDELIDFMRAHQSDTFCLTKFGSGLGGNPEEDMKRLWDQILTEPNARWAKIPTTDTVQ